MRNTKLILAMLAGCTVMSGAAFAQDATKTDKSATPTQTSSESMKSGTSDSSAASSNGAMKSDDSMKSSDSMKSDNGAMKSTHKSTKHKKAAGDTTAPAKSSSSGM